MTRLLIALLAFALAAGAQARSFKFADQGDVVSMDPYFFNESFLLNFTGNISHNPIYSLIASPGEGGQGQSNLGAFSNKRVDDLAGTIGSEPDAAKRQAMISAAFRIHHDEVGHLPLHQQALTWGMKKSVDPVQLADNFNYLRWVVVK